MTWLEFTLLALLAIAVVVIGDLAARRRPCSRVHWEPLEPREFIEARLSGRLADGDTWPTVLEVAGRPDIAEGTEVELIRGVDGTDRRRYRVMRSDRFAGGELRLEPINGD